jgi:predicted RNase H-related nuclease YkuK (DUF458 family)
MQRKINIGEVRDFILKQSPETKIYIGGDSERINTKEGWVVDYTLAIVVHIDGKHGAKIFGEIQREKDYNFDKVSKPRFRLMNEVYKIAELYLALHDVLEDREVQVHLDINPGQMYGSSCVINEAIGYIKATCNVVPLVKPQAFAASYAADRLKEVLANQRPILAA